MFNIYPKIRLALAALLLIVFSVPQVNAQVKIGSPSIPINSDAVLDLSNTGSTGNNKGLLYPTVQLVSTISASPLANMTAGMAVYNLLAAGSGTTAVVPGLYLNNGTIWVLFSAAPTSAATFVAGSLFGFGTPSGTYDYGIPVTGNNTQAVVIGVATAGTYNTTTNTVNGVAFSASGTFSNTGTNIIVLTASGTPTTLASTFAYTLSLAGQTCTFNVTFIAAATFGATTQTQTSSGPLYNTATYTGSYTIPYTTGNGSSYPAYSQTYNGLTLSHPAGTYTGSGSVVYSLSGTWTGATDYVTFTVPEGYTPIFGDAIHSALSTSQSAYAYTAPNNWVSITPAEYANVAGIVKSTSKYFNLDAQLISSGTSSTSANYTYSNYGGNILVNNYPIAVAIRDNPTTSPTTMAGIQFKFSTNPSLSSVYVDFPATGTTTPDRPPSIPLAAATTYYFVLKSPTFITNNSTFCAAYLPSPNQGSLFNNGVQLYYAQGNVNSLQNVGSNNVINVQMLATPFKNW